MTPLPNPNEIRQEFKQFQKGFLLSFLCVGILLVFLKPLLGFGFLVGSALMYLNLYYLFKGFWMWLFEQRYKSSAFVFSTSLLMCACVLYGCALYTPLSLLGLACGLCFVGLYGLLFYGR